MTARASVCLERSAKGTANNRYLKQGFALGSNIGIVVCMNIDFMILRAAMNDQGRSPSREHHFYVSTAKFLFHHHQHGIVAVRDPIRLADAKQRGLDPILLAAVHYWDTDIRLSDFRLRMVPT